MRDGEWPQLLTMGSIFFLLFTCLIYGRSIRSSLFLKTYGIEMLPQMYLATYVVLAVVATLYTALVDRFDKRRILAATSLFFSALFFASKFLIALKPFVAFIFIAVEVNAILTIIQFWTLSDDAYTGRDGKRLFPLIMLFGLATASVAALCMKPVVGLIGAENIFILLGVFMFINFIVVRGLKSGSPAGSSAVAAGSKSEGSPPVAARTKESPFKRYLGELRDGFAYIAGSRFMLAYTAMTLAIYLVNGVIEFQFANAANAAIDDLNELTEYFGLVQGGATFIAFLTNLFFTSWVIEAIGVRFVVLLYPAAIFIALAAMTWKFGLLTGTATKVTNDIFLYSIHDTVSSVLLNPVPERFRSKARIFIQGIVRPGAAVVSSVFLIFAVRGMTNEALCFTALMLVFVWFAASRVLGRNYINVLVENLRDGEVDLKKHSLETLSKLHSKGVEETLVAMVRSGSGSPAGNERERLFAAHLLLDMASPKSLAAVAALSTDEVSHIRLLAVRAMSYGVSPSPSASNDKAATLSNILTSDPSPEVRVEAAMVFAAVAEAPAPVLSAALGGEEERSVRRAIIRALAAACPDGKSIEIAEALVEKLTDTSSPSVKVVAAVAIAEFSLKEHSHLVVSFLKDSNDEVRAAAIDGLGLLKDDRAIPDLIALLSSDAHSQHAYECLISYDGALVDFLKGAAPEMDALSPGLLTPLLSVVGEVGDRSVKEFLVHFAGARHERVRLGAMKALARVAEKTERLLFADDEVDELCEREVERAIETRRLMELMTGGAYGLYLADRFSAEKEVLLAILTLRGGRDAVAALSESLESEAKRTLDTALEALETLLPGALRRRFMSVFEKQTREKKAGGKQATEKYDKVDRTAASVVESTLTESARSGHPLERLTAIHDLGELKQERLLHVFMANSHSKDVDVNEAALHAISKLDPGVIEKHIGEIRSAADKDLLTRFGLA